MSAGALELRAVTRRFGETVAVDDVTLDVQPGEFVTFLGPSGSGKTTTLRVIAGFLKADAGAVELDGKDMTGVPPYRRDIGMVFQNYALFPHMTAAQNVAFPLEMRSVARAERRRKVEEALELVHLGGLAGRYPRELSGGQQQRVALARAFVFGPRLLLMDEPLGALDKKLRETLQLEIMRISRQLKVTVVYVTHDQEEALVMSDRIAIYNQGRIEQVGVAEDLYERPASLFVADFIGDSNFFRKPVVANGKVMVVRPERIRVVAPGAGRTSDSQVRISGVVREVIYLGSARKYVIELEDRTFTKARGPIGGDETVAAGDRVDIVWDRRDAILLDESPAA